MSGRFLAPFSVIAVALTVFVTGAAAPQQPPAASQPRPPEPPARDARKPSTPGTATIAGRIVGGDTGTALRRAVVRVAATELPQGTATITDKDGRYEIRGLPAGRYTLTVNRPGYITMVYGQRRPREPGTPIDVREAERRDHVDVMLPRGGALAGRVVDEFGEPVARASVQSLQLRFVNGEKQLVPVGAAFNTPDTGEFRLWDLLPGDYYLAATLRDQFADAEINDNREGYAPTYYPSTEMVDDAQRFTLAVGQEQHDLVIALRPVRTAHLSGTILGASGQPPASGAVTLRQSAPTGGIAFTRQANITNGTFVFVNIPPGQYVVEGRTAAQGKVEAGSAPVAVAGSDVSGLTLIMSTGATLRGQIVFDGAAPPSPKPEELTLAIRPTRTANGVDTVTTRIRTDWTFEAVGLFDARLIRIGGVRGSLAGWQLKSVVLDGQDVTDTPLIFKSTETVEGAVITLTRRTTEITGTVIDDKSAVTSGYIVVVFARDSRRWTPQSRFIRTGRGDQRGTFAIRGLPPEEYLAIAVESIEPGQEMDPQFLERLQSRASSVSLAEGESRTLTLKISREP